MEIVKNIVGLNNQLDIGKLGKLNNSSITIKGNNNRVLIEDGAWLRNLHIVMESDDNFVTIGRDAKITGRLIQKLTPGNRIEIGAGTTAGQLAIVNGEGKSVRIGEDCMIAFSVEIRTTDSHAVIDAATGARINQAGDIFVGDHVWLAAHAILLKGTRIARNSVVGIRSVVTTQFDEEGSLISGIPARAIRSGISWKRPLLG